MTLAHQLTNSASASSTPAAIMHSNSMKLTNPPMCRWRSRSARTYSGAYGANPSLVVIVLFLQHAPRPLRTQPARAHSRGRPSHP